MNQYAINKLNLYALVNTINYSVDMKSMKVR